MAFVLIISLIVLFVRKNANEFIWLTDITKQKIKRKTFKKENVTRILSHATDIRPIDVKYTLRKLKKDLLTKGFAYYYLPSIQSFFVFFSFAFFVFLISHINDFSFVYNYWKHFLISDLWNLIIDDISETKHNLYIAILSGEAAVVFALVFFVAESIRGARYEDDKRVLLKVSSLWLLAVGTILSLLAFLWFGANSFSLIFPILNGIIIIISFAKVIRYLVDPNLQEEARRKFLKDRVRRSFERSILLRLSQNQLRKELDDEIKDNLQVFSSIGWVSGELHRYIQIKHKKVGWVEDINILSLKNLVSNINLELSFSVLGKEFDAEKSLDTPIDAKKATQLPKVILLKNVGEVIDNEIVNKENNTVLLLPIQLDLNPLFKEEIEKQVNRIFRVSQELSPSIELQNEMQKMQDHAISVIKEEKKSEVEKIVAEYRYIAEVILEIMRSFNLEYSSDNARNERSSLFGGWTELTELRNGIKQLLEAASKCSSRRIISSVVYLPISIAVRALNVSDQLLFQECLQLSRYIYHLTKDAQPIYADLAKDHSWRHINELFEFYLVSQIKNAASSNQLDKLESLAEFIQYAMRVYQDLLKDMIEQKDIQHFSEAFSEFKDLFEHLNWTENEHSINNLKKIQNGVDEQWIRKSEAKYKLKSNLEKWKRYVVGALSAHALSILRFEKDPTKMGEFFCILESSLPTTIENLEKLYADLTNYSIQDTWGWSFWDRIADGKAHYHDSYSKYDFLFCLHGLKVFSRFGGDAPVGINFETSREFVSAINEKGEGRLASQLEEISKLATSRNFKKINIPFEKIEDFKRLLKSLRKTYSSYEQKNLINKEISNEKVHEFRTQIQEKREKSSVFRGMLKHFDRYKECFWEKNPDDLRSYGFNQIGSKEPFFEKWHVHYADFGGSFGRGLGQSEDTLIFKQLIDTLEHKKVHGSLKLPNSILEGIEAFNFAKPLIVANLYGAAGVALHERFSEFQTKHGNRGGKSDLVDLLGFYGVWNTKEHKIPVFGIRSDSKDLVGKMILLDSRELGEFRQYSPKEKDGDEKFIENGLLVKVLDLNQDNNTRQRLLDQNPNWLQEQEGPEEYLRQHVLINIYERFEYDHGKNGAGLVLSLENESADEEV